MTLMLYALCLLNYPYFHSMYIFTRVLITNLSHCIWAPNTFCSSTSCSYYIKNKNNTSVVFTYFVSFFYEIYLAQIFLTKYYTMLLIILLVNRHKSFFVEKYIIGRKKLKTDSFKNPLYKNI